MSSGPVKGSVKGNLKGSLKGSLKGPLKGGQHPRRTSTGEWFPLPEGAPLVSLIPGAWVPPDQRTDSWGEVRSAEASGDWEACRRAAWRYLWTERPESEVHHIAAALVRLVPADHRPGVVAPGGVLLSHRWNQDAPVPTLRGLLLDARLGWGWADQEPPTGALSRAESATWLRLITEELALPASQWSYQWAHAFCPVEAGLPSRIEAALRTLREAPLNRWDHEEGALLARLCSTAWDGTPLIGQAPEDSPSSSSRWELGHYNALRYSLVRWEAERWTPAEVIGSAWTTVRRNNTHPARLGGRTWLRTQHDLTERLLTLLGEEHLRLILEGTP